jgi:uncharacterized Tic20 family protein
MTAQQSTIPTQDERIMAALAHVSAVLPMVGIVAPIVVWATQKDKSEYVRFQALQAIAYQLTMILAWFLGMACYMGSFFLTFCGVFLSVATTSSEPGPGDFLRMLPFFTPFVVFGCIFLGAALFIIYGIVGAVQTFRGTNFRYIIIGGWVTKFLQNGNKG